MNDTLTPAHTATENRIALLIDAENIPATAYDAIASQLAQRGQVASRYIFGQWPRMSRQWREITLTHLLQQVSTLSVGQKNGADIALTIQAMDILHRNEADTIAIASSDADFTQLAVR
ncbi:MAG: NYN domain-containing protein, partial [Gammaproteobacteria bacterium]|nr:NYN domain-containing protein [Gammaproteobacteria bacterium]